MRTIGMMAWRIGAILDIDEQIEWIRRAGFQGVGFHASCGVTGKWQGVDPSATGSEARARLRHTLSGFSLCEVHVPVSWQLRRDRLGATADALIPMLAFAGEIGATIVTVHAKPPTLTAEANSSEWTEGLDRLNAAALENGVVIGLEATEGFEWIAGLGLSNVGATLDVGHMYRDGGKPLQAFGTIGEVARRLGGALAHLHVHDCDGVLDHIELGTGNVDFGDLIAALREIGYRKGLCLELNPDRVSPEGMLRSREWLRARMGSSG